METQDYNYIPGIGDLSIKIYNNQLNTKFIRYHSCLGYPYNKRNNIHHLSDENIIYSVGNICIIYNIQTFEQIILHVVSNYGIGSICVSANKQYIAISTKCNNPNIYIYEYPSLKIIHILKNGCENIYNDMEFDTEGTRLATISGYPDYLLTIWEWRTESILLHTKAFSQDIYRVSFSPQFLGRLTTSGTGHIRFWRMAETFTGLKLKSEIGKFGQIELSDISAFAELPDGKILSGTETGYMLLWDSNLIQMVVGRKNKQPCHHGMIEYIAIEDNNIITAGADGILNIWELSPLENGDVEGEDMFIMEPITTYSIGEKIRGISRSPEKTHWIVQDQAGLLYKFSDSGKVKLLDFHSEKITGLSMSRWSNNIFSSSLDGSLRIWDLLNSTIINNRKFNNPITCMAAVPTSLDSESACVMLGFSDGVIRLIKRTNSKLALIGAWKPHTKAVRHISFSMDNIRMATAGDDNTIFFFDCAKNYSPLGFFNTVGKINAMNYYLDLMVCIGNQVLSYSCPSDSSNSSTFCCQFTPKVFNFSPLKSKDNEQELTSNITAILPTGNESDFYVCVNGTAAQSTHIHVCNMTSKTLVSSFSLSVAGEYYVSFLSLSFNGQYLLIGLSNGSVQIRPVSNLVVFMNINVHDLLPITYITLSADNSVLLSASSDGIMFTHVVNLNKALEFYSNPDNVNIEPLAFPEKEDNNAFTDVEEVADITDPKQYSLEESKLKLDEDNKLMDAEQKKQLVKMKIAHLRSSFLALKEKNNLEPESSRLPASELEFDPKYKADLIAKEQEKSVAARHETAWISEKHSLALAKLRANFLGNLLMEQIPLSGFRNNVIVSSFRTPDLPDFLKKSIEEVHFILEEESARRANEESKAKSAERNQDLDDSFVFDASKSSKIVKGKSTPGVSQSQLRKQARQERKKKREKLEKRKPDPNIENPADFQLVKHAEENMGDFKLKTDKNYVVPERQRVNAVKKRQQMVLLQESVHFIKMGLNERFLALRDLKRRIIENIKKDNIRIREISAKLRIPEESLFEPTLDLNEYPENRDIVSKQDLMSYEQELEKKKAAAQKAKNQSAYSGGNEEEPEKPKHRQTNSIDEKVDDFATEVPKDPASIHANRLAGIPLSLIEQNEVSASVLMLHHERRSLLNKIEKTITTFDQAVADLRVEKLKLDADLKTTNIKLLVLYQELLMLKQFEGSELALNAKLQKSNQEESVIVADINECQEKLQIKLNEITNWQEKDKQLLIEFNSTVGEKSEFYPALLKIYKRRIKRSKKKFRMEDDGSDEDIEDDVFEEDDFDDNKSDDGNDETCPINCENAVYEKVLDLREKRLDQEDVLADINKAVEDLRKQNERLQQRERLIDKDVKAIDREIQQFQTEKQRALNQITVAVPLRLIQLKYEDVNGDNTRVHIPTDLSNALIFTSNALSGLHNRIVDVQNEKVALKKEIADLRNRHKTLIKQNKSKEEEIDVERKKCENVQLLKFGKLIDIELLDRMTFNASVEELKVKLHDLEAMSIVRLNELDNKFKQSKNKLVQVLEENTEKLALVSTYTEQQYALEEKLNVKHKNVHVGDTGPLDQRNADERNALIETVKSQAAAIETLKSEINMLRHKGGHVFSNTPLYNPPSKYQIAKGRPGSSERPYISSGLDYDDIRIDTQKTSRGGMGSAGGLGLDSAGKGL